MALTGCDCIRVQRESSPLHGGAGENIDISVVDLDVQHRERGSPEHCGARACSPAFQSWLEWARDAPESLGQFKALQTGRGGRGVLGSPAQEFRPLAHGTGELGKDAELGVGGGASRAPAAWLCTAGSPSWLGCSPAGGTWAGGPRRDPCLSCQPCTRWRSRWRRTR